VSVTSRVAVIALVLHASFAARAQDDDIPPGAKPPAANEPAALEEGVVDTYGGIAFGARVVGLPALVIGGGCLGVGLHALAASGALNTSGLGTAGYWTNFGGLIATGVSILPIVIGEIGMGTGAFTDALAAMDLTAAQADGSGLAWSRMATWELAAHTGALGAGLAVGGVLAAITSIVMPSIYAFDAAGTGAYNDLFSLGLLTSVSGIIVVLIAAVLAGTSFWLDGAATEAYRKAARGKRAAAGEGAALVEGTMFAALEPRAAMAY